MKNQTIEYYNRNAMDYVLETKSVDFTKTQDLFLSCLEAKASVLDFGCGSGRDSRYFKEKGFSVTAMDGSGEFCRIASAFTGIEVRQQLFQELSDCDCYDGIWACASILHAKTEELPDIFRRMLRALKKNGILYASFKYGTYEGMRGERYYTDFNEEKFQNFLQQFPELRIEKMWISGDVRPERGEEKWLNIILRRESTP